MSNDMSNSDDLSRQMLSMPTLGRHFDLGTVYDAIRDATIPGKQNKSKLSGWACLIVSFNRLSIQFNE